MENELPLLRTSDLENEFQQSATLTSDKVSVADKANSNLQKVKASSDRLRAITNKTITKSEPFLFRLEDAILFPNTINMVQGQTGVHKSRLVEMLCAAILTTTPNADAHLGFLQQTQNLKKTIELLYIDTERNLTEQFPMAIQRIRRLAGFEETADVLRFSFTSLIEIPRTERFETLNALVVERYTQEKDKHFMIVLDVVSDCILDFNRSEMSMQLIDMMNQTINSCDVTFIVILHENYGSEKARGHLGSELYNKSSTVLQIAAEQGNQGDASDVFRVKYLKCRNSRRYEPFFVQYDETTQGLRLATEDAIGTTKISRQTKALTDDVIAKLQEIMSDGAVLGKNLIEELCQTFSVSDKIIKERLENIINQSKILHINKRQFYLHKGRQKQSVIYKLIPAIEPPSTNDNTDVTS